MTTAQYQNLTPREAANAASPRLFSFLRIRGNDSTRFYPGDGAKLHFANRDVDTLEIPGVPGGFLAAGDVVKAYYRGTCVFRGDVATIVEARSRGTDATQTVTCVGPWSKMQRLVYRQLWKTGPSTAALSSRLILNQTDSGATQTLNLELYEIANSAKTSCGYSVSLSNVDVSEQILPSDECRDITVADAIKRELRFFPKAVAFFDYSGETPALKIKKNASPATAAYVANIPKTSREYVYNAHPITGVDLEIEATGTINGVEYHQIDHQIAGDTTAGNPDCLYATLQIKGASSNTVRQSFKSITEDVPSDLEYNYWWKQKHPRLANVALNQIEIVQGSGQRTGTLPRISAATAGELQAAGLQCEVSKFSCLATIHTNDETEEKIYLTLDFLTTNATGTAANPKTYTWVTESSAESGETVPEGLAATILAERSGALLSERLSIRLGDTFPTLGDAIVETEGTVFLQSFDVDCGSLTAELNFGVPEYLTPEDMASLLSGFRNKRTTSSSSMRSTGKVASDGNVVEMGSIKPLSSSEFAPGTKAKTTIASSSSGEESSSGSVVLDTTGERPKIVISDGSKSITLDLADFPDDCEGAIKIHALQYNDRNGDTQIYHGLFCDDIDLSDLKAIKDTSVEAIVGNPGGTQITFNYTDGTSDTFIIYNGLKGGKGDKGDDGDTPEITSEKSGGHTYIYADGTLIATLDDGRTPDITAEKQGTTTTIYVDGNAVAQIEDGGITDYDSITCISGIRFEMTGGKLKCILSKQTFNVPNTFEMHPVEETDVQTIDICDAKQVDVVTSESYSTSTHKFTNTRRKITVLADVAATGQTPFTATALSAE